MVINNSGHLSYQEAQRLFEKVKRFGTVPANKVLIVKPKDRVCRNNSSGLILPEDSNLHRNEGVIIGCGIVEAEFGFTQLRAGDVVTFGEYAGKEVAIYGLLHEEDELEYSLHILSLTEVVFITRYEVLPENIK